MLSKSKRLTSAHIDALMAQSRSFHGTHLSIRIRKDVGRGVDGAQSENKQLFAVIASKKVAKTAVMRNRIRRRLYSAIRKTAFFKKTNIDKTQHIHYAVFAKATAIDTPLPVIIEELNSLFDQSSAFK